MRKNDIADISPRDPMLALVLLTRLPLPALPEAAFARQAAAVWAFPLAGLAVARWPGPRARWRLPPGWRRSRWPG